MMSARFQNRTEAGQRLATELVQYAKRQDVLVLGIPRGGVPVAFEVSQVLGVPLDVIVVRKLGVPGDKELAMGAVAFGGVRILNDDIIQQLGVGKDDVERVIWEETRELNRRELAYRGSAVPVEVHGKTVILVDDGIATGSSILAAIQAVKLGHPDKVVVAVPVTASAICEELEDQVDEFVSILHPKEFLGVAQWYVEFGEVSDSEVTELLSRARAVSAESRSECTMSEDIDVYYEC